MKFNLFFPNNNNYNNTKQWLRQKYLGNNRWNNYDRCKTEGQLFPFEISRNDQEETRASRFLDKPNTLQYQNQWYNVYRDIDHHAV